MKLTYLIKKNWVTDNGDRLAIFAPIYLAKVIFQNDAPKLSCDWLTLSHSQNT